MNRFKFDTHIHLDLFDNRDEIIRYIEKEKSYTIAVTNLPILYKKYIQLYGNFKYVRFALGFHPQLVYKYNNQMEIFLKNIKQAKYIGEVGLDYSIKDKENREIQRKIFKEIIKACNLYGNKVVSVHSRLAVDVINNIVGEFKGNIIMHWFTGNEKELQQSIENGYYFSINEKMLNSNKKRLLIKKIPVDKILLESDAPFLKNDKLNYSVEFMDNIIEELANIYLVDKYLIEQQLKNNFKRVINV